MTSARAAAAPATVKYHDERLSMTRPWTKTTVGRPGPGAPSRCTCRRTPLATTSATAELLQCSGERVGRLAGEKVSTFDRHMLARRQGARQFCAGVAQRGPGAAHDQRRAGHAGELLGRRI